MKVWTFNDAVFQTSELHQGIFLSYDKLHGFHL